MRTYNPTTVRIAELLARIRWTCRWSSVNKALADGRIDNMITSAVTGVENQVWGHLKYYYEINAWFPKNIVFVKQGALRGADARRRASCDCRRRPAPRRAAGAASQAVMVAAPRRTARARHQGRDASDFEIRKELRTLRREVLARMGTHPSAPRPATSSSLITPS